MEINNNIKSKVVKILSGAISRNYILTYCELIHLKVRVPRVLLILFFFKDFIYLFLERGEVREKQRKRNIDM